MAREARPEFVDGKKQLLVGRRCPRCLQVQHHVRVVRTFDKRVAMYSCMECKQMISLEVAREPEVVKAAS